VETATIYYEDFEVGHVREIGSYTVSKDEIVEFARRFDPQPFHVDEVAARESIFGGLTASSCHTFALVGLINARDGLKSAAVANLGSDALRFPAPVRPGDTLTLTGECTSKRLSRSRPAIGIISSRTLLTNQNGDVVMESMSKFMVKRREGAR